MKDMFGADSNAQEAQQAEPKRRGRYRDRRVLNAADVCAILESCLRSKVQKFSFGGLEVEFKSQAVDETEAIRAGCPQPVEGEVSQGRLDGLAALGDRVEDELEMLKITNPVLYEKFAAEQHEAS